jgi:hypothetical protein
MDPEVSLPCPKDLCIKPYPEPVEFIPNSRIVYLVSILILSSKRYLILQIFSSNSGINRNSSSSYVSSARFLAMACLAVFNQSLLCCSLPFFVLSSLTAPFCSSYSHLFLGLSTKLFPLKLPSRIHENEYYN